jgi:hypothetical protein
MEQSKDVTLIEFKDAATGGEAIVIIRKEERGVFLGMSLRDDGDLEILLDLPTLRRIIAALQQSAV